MTTTAIAWPENIAPVDRWSQNLRKSVRHYPTPDGEMVGTTTAIKCLGLGMDALIRWSCDIERHATLASMTAVLEKYPGLEGQALVDEILKQLGPERKAQKEMQKAGDIGSQVHVMIQHTIRTELSLPAGEPPVLAEAAWLAFAAWEEWWGESGITPLRCEQTVWDSDWKYAGTFDLYGLQHGEPGIWDWKSSKYVYDDHHIQLAAYCKAARNWAPVKQAFVVRIPKSLDDPFFKTGEIEPVPLGKLYNRTVTESDLLKSMKAALDVWNVHFAEAA